MQLTARFAMLATALIYGSVNVLALPRGAHSHYYTREAEYGMEARDVGDEVSYITREVPEWLLDARSLFDSEDYVAREFPPNDTPPESAAVEKPNKSKYREAMEKREGQ